MTHSHDGASAGELREVIARIIDPAAAKLLDAGHLNQWGQECWEKVLFKADEILRALSPSPGLGEEGVHLAPNVRGQEPHSSVLTSAQCQSEGPPAYIYLEPACCSRGAPAWQNEPWVCTCENPERSAEYRLVGLCDPKVEVNSHHLDAISTWVCLSASMIRSGEDFTPRSEADYRAARVALSALSSEAPSPKSEEA